MSLKTQATSSALVTVGDNGDDHTKKYFRTIHNGMILSPSIARPLCSARDQATQILYSTLPKNNGLNTNKVALKDSADNPPTDMPSDPLPIHNIHYTCSYAKHGELYLHIGAQPNNSPHLGTITVFTSAFIHAAFIQRHYTSIRKELRMKNVQVTHWPDELKVIVSFDVVDTAPDNSQKINRGDGLQYQKSHRDTNAHEEFIPDYIELMSKLHSRYGVGFVMTNQSDLMSSAHFRDALLVLLRNIEEMSVELAPEKEALALRRACSVEGCGIAEKHGIRNRYNLNGPYTTIDFDCPDHGHHQVSLANLDEIKTLEMNTPMRNLIRMIIYSMDTQDSLKDPDSPVRLHKRVTGADYAGFYQEQLLWRQFFRLDNVLPPYISYAPLITDWAGSKISKSLYVKNGAYKYLEESKMDWLLSYQKMKERGVDIEKVFDIIEGWMQDPNEYSRPHTVDSLQMMHFNDRGELPESIEKFLIHDGEVHDPLGGGAYVFGKNLLIAIPRYLGIIPPTVHFSRNQALPNADEQLPPCILSIHIDVTRNDPNVGVLINTILPFVLGRALKDDPRNPITQVEVVVHVDDMNKEQTLLNFLDECVENTKQAVTYRLETEEDFRSSPTTFHVLRTVLENRYVTEQFSLFSSPITHPCPIEGCGTLNNLSSINPYQIEDATITLAFECNTHGRRLVILDNKGSPCSVQLSKPLRRLVRTVALAQDTVYSRYEGIPTADGPSTRVHMQIQGWENAGTLQEQMLWRPLILLDDAAVRAAPPVIVYTPLICDWAGAKLSSLMYVEGKYEYLKENGMEYLLSLEALRREGRSLDPLFRLVDDWVENPKKLFRPYSIAHIHRQYEPNTGRIDLATGESRIAEDKNAENAENEE